MYSEFVMLASYALKNNIVHSRKITIRGSKKEQLKCPLLNNLKQNSMKISKGGAILLAIKPLPLWERLYIFS